MSEFVTVMQVLCAGVLVLGAVLSLGKGLRAAAGLSGDATPGGCPRHALVERRRRRMLAEA